MSHTIHPLVACTIAAAALTVAACSSDAPTGSGPGPDARRAPSPSEWTAPFDLGTPPNVANADTRNGFETNHGRSLYLGANVIGTTSGRDIYVSQRQNELAPWGPAKNLGSVINTDIDNVHGDNHPNITRGGHWMFFSSPRDGGCGDLDIWMSYRANVHDDFAWQTPTNLGCEVNHPGADISPVSHVERGGRLQLYFASDRDDPDGFVHFYLTERRRNGSWTTPTRIDALSSPFDDNKLAISADGLEAFFSSDRPLQPGDGEEGDFNVWASTRRSIDAPWSKPVPVILGFGLPSLSRDGQRLYLTAPSVDDPTVAHVFMSTRVGQQDFAGQAADDDDADDLP